jgi:hypothetical protein
MNEKDKVYVIIRGPPGVFVGKLVSEDEGGVGNVELEDAFCLWFYSGANSLNQLAEEGVKSPQNCKFSVSVPRMRLKQIFQIIPLSENAKRNLLQVKRWKL